MKQTEFLNRYHAFRTSDPLQAAQEAMRVSVEGNHVVVVHFAGGFNEYALMLASAAEVVRGMDGITVWEPVDLLRELAGL